jgi:hypothetical protein
MIDYRETVGSPSVVSVRGGSTPVIGFCGIQLSHTENDRVVTSSFLIVQEVRVASGVAEK